MNTPDLHFDFTSPAPQARPWRATTPTWLRELLEAARRWFEQTL